MRTFEGVTLGILLPLLLIPIALVVVFTWYRRKLVTMRTDDREVSVSGTRLTSEALQRLPQPPWRIVIEIAQTALEGVDHVAIGPGGVVPLLTRVADRPGPGVDRDPIAVGSTSLARAAVGAALADTGLSSMPPARVYWGTPHPDQPAGLATADGVIDVEGQRLEDWLQRLPPPPTGPLSAAQVDACWRAILIAIGRPDPLP